MKVSMTCRVAALAIGVAFSLSACQQEPTASAPKTGQSAINKGMDKPLSYPGPAIPDALKGKAVEPASSGEECGIESDYLDGSTIYFKKGEAKYLEGWVLNRKVSGSPSDTFFRMEGEKATYFAPATLTSRQGLGVRLGDQHLDSKGFDIRVGLDNVEPGVYSVGMAQLIDGKVHLCATGATAKVN